MEQRLIDANALKEMLIELLEDIKRNPRMDGYEMCIIASCDTLCQMIDDAPSIWACDAIDLSLKLLDEHERGMLFEYRNLGCTIDHLRELIQAEQDGRLVVLPCKVGDAVFTIKEEYFNCEQCEHGSKSKYCREINRVCCDLSHGEHCPYYIEQSVAEGFTICADNDRKLSISAPGEWGCEGLETFIGVDGKWYLTRDAAETALVQKGDTHETDPI